MSSVAVSAIDSRFHERARVFADSLNLPCVNPHDPHYQFLLMLTDTGVELHTCHQHFSPLVVDFIQGQLGYRRLRGGGHAEHIAKAVGLKGKTNLHVLDATAGFGRDGFILAGLGCRVTMLERSPVIGALLKDGLSRAAASEEIDDVMGRIQFHVVEAKNWLEDETKDSPDVVYLDPMYPERNKSALVKKEMRIFRELVGDDRDAKALLEAALKVAKKRVVVKRPRLGAKLSDIVPDTFVLGKSTRYDIYLVH